MLPVSGAESTQPGCTLSSLPCFPAVQDPIAATKVLSRGLQIVPRGKIGVGLVLSCKIFRLEMLIGN